MGWRNCERLLLRLSAFLSLLESSEESESESKLFIWLRVGRERSDWFPGGSETDQRRQGGNLIVIPHLVMAFIEPETPFNTLEEPISTTISRDLKKILTKLRYVLLTSGTDEILREWDLYGPLINCLLLGSLLTYRAAADQASSVFTAIFVIIWGGAAIITLNAQLLGGSLSFFQSVCLLGYCVFPLTIASIVSWIFSAFFFRLFLFLIAFAWSTRSSAGFLGSTVPQDRKSLALYPVFLFYLSLTWICFTIFGQSS